MGEGSESVSRITRRPARSAYLLAAIALVVGASLVLSSIGSDEHEEGAEPQEPGPGDPTAIPPEASIPTRFSEVDGVPLAPPTGLEILVGGTLIDVDEDRRTWVGGLTDRPPGQAVWLQAFQVGRATVIVRAFSCPGCGPDEVRVLVLPGGDTRSELVIADDGIHVAPADDGMWIARTGVDRCVIQKIDTDGAPVTPGRPIDCGLVVREQTDLGLLAHSRLDPDGVAVPTDLLLDPADLTPRFHARRILAVAGDRILAAEGPLGFELRGADGSARVLDPPPTSGEPLPGAVSPDDRFVAVEFAGPSTDLWVLDLVERRWLHVPAFPTSVHPRMLGVSWADDGRLVILGPLVDSLGDRDQVLATWVPGDERVAFRRVDYPYGELLVRSAAGAAR